MITMVDFSPYPYSLRAGSYGGQAGLKDGIIYKGTNYILKYPKTTKDMDVEGISYTTSPLSEYIGSQIYHILGYDVHETELGEKAGKVVVGCRDFCEGPVRLFEMRTLKNQANRELAEMLEGEFHSTGSEHFVDLRETLLHLEHNPILSKIPGIRERFWDQVVVDILINNNDRNNGNWGILVNEDNGEYRLAPVYDNGASFLPKIGDGTLAARNASPQMLESSALNGITVYAVDGRPISAWDMLSFGYEGLKAAIIRNVPLFRDRMADIRTMIWDIPERHGDLDVCSGVRKENYIRCMELRIERMLVPVYEKATGIVYKKPEIERSPVFEAFHTFVKDASDAFTRAKDGMRQASGEGDGDRIKTLVESINGIKRDVAKYMSDAVRCLGSGEFSRSWGDAPKDGIADELVKAIEREAKRLEDVEQNR